MTKELKKVEAYKVLEEKFNRMYKVFDGENPYGENTFGELYYDVEKKEDENYLTFTFKERHSGRFNPRDPISVIYDKNHYMTMINFYVNNFVGNITFMNGDSVDIGSLLNADSKELFRMLYACGEFSELTPLLNENVNLDYVEYNLGILADFGYITKDDKEDLIEILNFDCDGIEEYKKALNQYVDIDKAEEFLYDVNMRVICLSCIFKEIKKRFYSELK